MANAKSREPGAVLLEFIGKYRLNPSRLAAAVKLSQSTIRQITLSKMKITVPVALRLARFFGNPVEFWTKLQMDYDLERAGKDKKLASILKSIEKVQKPGKDAVAGKARKPGTGSKRKTR